MTPAVLDGTAAPLSPLSLINGMVAAQIGGKPAGVVFSGLAPGFAGLAQINVVIPQGLSAGNQPAFVSINGVPRATRGCYREVASPAGRTLFFRR